MKNKKVIGLIIIISIILIIGGFILFSIFNNNSNNSNPSGLLNNGSQKDKNINKKISQIHVDYDHVVALTEEGKLYLVQDQLYTNYYGNGVPKVVETPMIIAENVQKFFSDGTAYIDFDNNLYRCGLNPVKGGLYDEYVKLGTNIKEVDSRNLGIIAVSHDGELYIFGNSEYYPGAEKNDSSLTKLETNSNKIIDACMIGYRTVYLTNDGELFVRGYGETEFKKELDNIASIDDEYNVHSKDGKIYKQPDTISSFVLKEDSVSRYPDDYPNDVKTLLYDTYNFLGGKDNTSSDAYVYIDNSDNIVLYDVTTETLGYENGMPIQDTKVEKKELDNSFENIDKILKFVKNYQY